MTSASPGSDRESTVSAGINNGLTANRIFSLDVIRGIALLGILMISIWEFGGFSANQQVFYQTGPHGGNYKLLTVVSVLFEGKMRALFSLVFGAGIVLYLTKRNHYPELSVPDLYIRRNMWLIILGVFNAMVLLWPGDILFQYGVMGILLFPFFRMTRRGLLIAVLVTTLIYCGKTFWNYTDDIKTYKKFKEVTLVEEQFKKDSIARHQKDSAAGMVKDSLTKRDSAAAKKDTLTKEQKNNKSAWEGMLKGMKYDSTKDKEENKAMRSGYGKIWDHLLQKSQGKEAAWLYRTGIWDISSMMFLGMALLGFGFFNHRFSRSNYLIIALVGILTGVLLAWLRLGLYQEKLADYAKYITTHIVSPNQFFPLERLLMATGYAALLMFLLKTDFLQWLWQAFAAVGRMALSNYFLQTIACTLFFYGYGFGYFGRLSPAQLYFFVAETWLLQTAFSVIWLRYHHYGPAEWLWRWMTYGFKKFPNQKDKN